MMFTRYIRAVLHDTLTLQVGGVA